MKLILQNQYPFPFPEGLSEAEQDRISEQAGRVTMELKGVVHFQWLHTVTVEFDGLLNANRAHDITGWKTWGDNPRILEAKTSREDGYDHPAIIVRDKAYCGFMLVPDEQASRRHVVYEHVVYEQRFPVTFGKKEVVKA